MKKQFVAGFLGVAVFSAIAATILRSDEDFGGTTSFVSPARYRIMVTPADDAVLVMDFMNKPSGTFTNYSNPIYFTRTGIVATVVGGGASTEDAWGTNATLGGFTNKGSIYLVGPFTAGGTDLVDTFKVNQEGSITKIRSVDYSSWPSVQGAANSTLINNGSGALSWAFPLAEYLWSTNTATGGISNKLAPIDLFAAIANGTVTRTLGLSNTTIATVGSQGLSPFMEFGGHGWKTDATAASQPVNVRIGAVPIQGSAGPSVMYRIQSQTNGSAWRDVVDFTPESGQTNNGRYIAAGRGGGAALVALQAPWGTSTAKVFTGANEMQVDGATTVTFSTAGTSRISLTSSEIQPLNDNVMQLGLSGGRWRQIWHAKNTTRTSDLTVNDATLVSSGIAGASPTAVTTTWRYNFRMVMYVTNTVSTGGVKIDFDGGTATMTEFRAFVKIYDSTGLLASVQTTALATDISTATITDACFIEADIGFLVNGSGTFIPRIAEASDSAGALTLFRNSCLIVTDLAP